MLDKKSLSRICVTWLLAGGLLASCQLVEEDLIVISEGPVAATLKVPDNFPAPVIMETNPLTEEGILLGRVLFHDPSISANGRVSCASCHKQQKAFSDGVAIGGHGVSGSPLDRHSPALINVAWMNNGLFWDGGSKNLESQAFGPFTHADEMGMSLQELEDRLGADPVYVDLFSRAFEDGVNVQNAAKALAQFQRTLISSNSRYDRFVRREKAGWLNERELRGLALVRKHCGNCHEGELFTDNVFHNNGIDDDFSDLSHEMLHLGRYRISFRPEDIGAFKTPTLRNVMVTAPYMHDGRFDRIEDVLHHYAKGVKDAGTTSSLLYSADGKVGIPLSKEDKEDITAFLHTLTDSSFLNDPPLSPFNYRLNN